jgi:hypothetical protein
VGLRKLLSRQPAEDPLERLAELGRETAHHPTTRHFPRPARESDAAPVRVASVDEKVGDCSVVKAKRGEPPRSRSGYRWLSQRSRESYAAWHDFVSTRF